MVSGIEEGEAGWWKILEDTVKILDFILRGLGAIGMFYGDRRGP